MRRKINWFTVPILLMCISISATTLGNEPPSIRFGVMSLAQPARVYEQWTPMANYLEEKTGKKVELVVPRGFAKIKEAIENDEVDIFFSNSYVFYRLLREGKAKPVAQMLNIDDRIYSNSDIFVRSDSGIKTMADLKGKKFAFVSPMGAGGYLAPKALLQKNGIDTTVEMSESFTKNLSNSIHQVILKDVDGATMCGVNYRLMQRKIDTGELTIIAKSDDYPENVIGARASLGTDSIEKLKAAILTMRDDTKGKEILLAMESSKIRNFVAYDPAIEKVIEKLLTEAHIESK